MITFIPATIRVAFVFIFILVLIRKKVPLGHSFLLGSVILGFIFELAPFSLVRSIEHSLLHPKTLCLAAIVSLILILSSSMEQAGQMKRMLESFRGLVTHPKITLVTFPALIGLLPMPGGAVFSAPMVKELALSTKLDAHKLSYINYWFRHIWEHWWPLYPGVLLGTTLAEIDLFVFIAAMCPLSIVAVIAGYMPIKEIDDGGDLVPARTNASARVFIRELLPIIIAIMPGLTLGAALSYLFPGLIIAKELGLISALVAAILWIWYDNGLERKLKKKLVLDPHIVKMMYMVFSILLFKGILEDSNAVSIISEELRELHVPLFFITMALPLFVGGIVGISVAFVGTTFPILITLVHSFGEAHLMLPYMMLAMISGYTGVIFSPLHICLLLSNQYFETSLVPVYRLLMKPALVVLFTGIAYFWAMKVLTNII